MLSYILKVILALLVRITIVPTLIVVTSILIAFSIWESLDRASPNIAIADRLNIEPRLFAIAMLLGAFYIGIRYVIQSKDIDSWKERFYYGVAMLPLSYYALFTGVYSLLFSPTKTGGIFILAFWGFLIAEPIIRRKNHD